MAPLARLLFLTLALCGALLSATPARGAFGLTTSTDYYTVDTGSTPGLVFKIRRTDNGSSTQSPGDIMSLVYNGIEYQDQSRGSQVNSGFDWIYNTSSTVTVSATTVGTDYIKITVVAGDPAVSGVLTHYYLAHKGDACIYMATHFTSEPTGQSLCRYILRLQADKLPNGPTPSDLRGTDSTIESGDIFGFSATNPNTALIGQTRSKHYSNMRLKDWSYIGATGTNVGMWMARDNQEGGSGGPFYRSLLNQCGSDQEITYIVNYGETQTEAYRPGILNSYTLVFTNGVPPGALDTSWFGGMNLVGYVAPAGRGSVSGAGLSNRDLGYEYTVGFSNLTAQYWTKASPGDGSFLMAGLFPGTYTMKVYKNELAVYTASVDVAAGATTALPAIAISADPSAVVPLWRIGNWDGTPTELLNGDKITTMHPSDVRIAPWNPGPYVIGSSTPATGMPCYQWKNVDSTPVIQFTLTASQLVASTIRIGITTAYAGGRPNIGVNSWSNSKLPSASSQPDSRTLTVGSYRGNNTTYSFSVPASALVVGTNTLYVSPISGSSGTGYLSPGYSLDCLEMYQGTAQTVAVPDAPGTVNATGGDRQVALSWSAVSGALSYNVFRAAVSGGPYTIVASGLTGTTCTDTGLLNGTTYFYVINAANFSGTGPTSDEVSATAIPPGPPTAPTGLSASPYNASTALTWNGVLTASSYKVKRSTTNGSGYVTIKTVSTPNYSDFGLVNATTYYYVVSALNNFGESPDSAPVAVTPSGGTTVTFTSTATLDGYITGASGNTAGSSITTSGTARTGDSSANRQYKALFSFDTSSLPDDVIIQSATLKLKRSGSTGAPTALGSSCSADLKAGAGFNGSTALETADFAAAADATQVATLAIPASNGLQSTGALNAAALLLVSKTATTQFRVSFPTSTDNDGGNDYVSWYAGDDSTAANRPALEVTYGTGAAPSSVPVAHLPFDEASGTTAADRTGNNWTGTLVNGPVWVSGASAKINRALSLDGTNDHVTLPAGPLSTLNDFTISTWVNLRSVTNWARIFDFGTGTTNYLFLTPANALTGGVRFAIRTPSGAEQVIDGAAALTSGAWNHVAVTLSGTTGKLYVNGVLAGTNPSLTLTPASLGSTTINYLGRSQFAADPYLNGTIDDFKIYNHGLTAAEVAQLAAPPQAPDTVTAVVDDGRATISWSAVSGSLIVYNLRRATASEGPYTTIASAINSTTYADSNLTNGSTYYYTVNAQSGIAEGSDTAPLAVKPLALPTSFSATTFNGSVSLNWSAATGATSYNIKRSTISGGPYELVANVAGGTGYIDTTASPGVTYYYVISPVNETGEGLSSAQLTILASPRAPLTVAATPGHAMVALSWEATAGAATYNVLRSETNGAGYSELAAGLTTTSYVDTSTANGLTYYYVISAENAGGESGWSAQASATPFLTPATVRLRLDESTGTTAADSSGNGKNATLVNGPVWLTGTSGKINNALSLDGTNDYATLPAGVVSTLNDFTVSTWVKLNTVANWARIFDFGTGTSNYMFLTPINAVSGKVRFAIRSTAVAEQSIDGTAPLSAGVWKHVAVTISGSTGKLYVDGVLVGSNAAMTLKPSSLGSTTLNYLGRSHFAADPYLNGALDEFQIYNRALLPEEIALLATPPAAPLGLTAAGGTGQVSLSWEGADSVFRYNVLRATSSGGPYTNVASAISGTAYTQTGLSNGTPYYYVVTSSKGLAESAFAAVAVATPLAAPSGLSVTTGNAQVALSWNAVPGATGYTIKRSLSGGTDYGVIGSSATPSFVDHSVVNGATYYYLIAAVNTGATSVDSIEIGAHPALTFSQWAAAAFPGQSDAAIIGANADPDRDGAPNLLEYFSGTNPAVLNVGANLTHTLDGAGNLVMTFRRSKELSGVSYSVQQSANLPAWTDTGLSGTIVSDGGSYEWMRVVVPIGASSQLFLRLTVTGP